MPLSLQAQSNGDFFFFFKAITLWNFQQLSFYPLKPWAKVILKEFKPRNDFFLMFEKCEVDNCTSMVVSY